MEIEIEMDHGVQDVAGKLCPGTVKDISSFVVFDTGEELKNLLIAFPTSAVFRAHIKEINKAAFEAVPKEDEDRPLLLLPQNTRSPYYNDKDPAIKKAVIDMSTKYRERGYASVRQLERRLYDVKTLSKRRVNSEKQVAEVKFDVEFAYQ